MARIGFIGLGNMGGGMAANLAAKGHDVRAFDLSKEALDRAVAAGCKAAASAVEAVTDADFVVTMLPSNATGARAGRLRQCCFIITFRPSLGCVQCAENFPTMCGLFQLGGGGVDLCHSNHFLHRFRADA